jgi:hypothetical protein
MFHGCEITSASRVRRTTKSLELAQLTRDQVPTRENAAHHFSLGSWGVFECRGAAFVLTAILTAMLSMRATSVSTR